MPLAPTLLMLAVGGYRAGERQLWEDEYATWHASTLGPADFTRLIGHVDLSLSPYYLFMQVWITVFGDSELALRAPSVIAMAASAGLVAALGRRLFSTRVGLLAGLLFVAVPSLSRYAQEARPYGLVVLLAVLSTVLLLRALEQPTWPRWLGYGAVLVLLGYAHVVALSIVVGHALAVRYTARTGGRLRVWRWLGALVLAVSLVGPFALAAAEASGAISWIRADRSTLRAFPGQLFGSGAVAAILVGLAVVGLYLLVRRPGPQLPLLAGWALAPVVLTFVTFAALHLFLFRYLLFTVPAWVLLAGAGLDAGLSRLPLLGGAGSPRADPHRTARRWGMAAVALLAVVAVGAAGLPGQLAARHDPVLGYPDYRRAAGIIRADLRPGDSIAFGGLYFRARRGMTYENRDRLRPRDVFLAEPAEELGGYIGRECDDPPACLGGTARVWLVNTTLSADVFAELPRPTADLLRDRFRIANTWRLQHLHLVLLTY